MKKLDEITLERIKKVIDPYCRITWEQMQNISSYLQIKTYPAKKIIKAADSEEKIVRFILEGEMGLFYKDKKKEFCENIFSPGQLASDLISYIEEKPTPSYLVTYTPCTVVEFHRDMRSVILHEIPEFSEMSSAFLKIELDNALKRIRFLRQPASEKTQWVEKHRSDVFKFAPVRDVAQCLMISPEHFSRVRNEKGNKGGRDFSAKGFLKGMFLFLFGN